ncbi:hypothetical protein QBC34DRAFT_155228 [Podospora aff. communis PSN243]|uniref:C2H2-type domain-containing protein n=1 Tax=Podospora aff. communis PSN243 TaxID=3040156 RepID=A0AAV9H0C4_9PEZI|nr:hypothetical protein QBC34DRAFT_155228 [Podospora aff. communis PSN243]
MEDYEFLADPLTVEDAMLGLDPGLALPQDLNWHDAGELFFPEFPDDIHGAYWPPEPGTDSTYGATSIAMESFSAIAGGPHLNSNHFAIYIDNLGLDQGTAFPSAGQDPGGLVHGYHPAIESFSLDSPGPSTMSETLSPPSEPMLASLPTSPMTLLGYTRAPLQLAPLPDSSCPVEIHSGFTPTLGEILRTPETQPGEPQRRRRGRHQRVGCSQPSARERRMKERPEACEHCPKRFPFKKELDRHFKAIHCEEKEKYPCTASGCSKVYTRDDRLHRHGVAKHGWPPYGRRGPPKAANRGHRN